MIYGTDRGANDLYAAAATGHYSSSARNDPVKMQWERPWFAAMLGDVLRFLRPRPPSDRRALTIVDVGVGAGEGYDLLTAARCLQPDGPSMRYIGVDPSRSMAALAERRLAAAKGFDRVEQADIRDVNFASYDADLYLSVGAPYSELSADHLEQVLGRMLFAAAESDKPVAVIVDVYGQYCPAWLPAAAPRRHYAMSFFEDTSVAPAAVMEFYTPGRLGALVQRAIPPHLQSRVVLDFADRSVFASRHTSTLAYNPRLPPIRTIANSVLTGRSDPMALLTVRIPPSACHPAPLDLKARVQLERLVRSWNRLLDSPGGWAVLTGLRCLNNVRGVHASGIGHYLTGIILIQPSTHFGDRSQLTGNC